MATATATGTSRVAEPATVGGAPDLVVGLALLRLGFLLPRLMGADDDAGDESEA